MERTLMEDIYYNFRKTAQSSPGIVGLAESDQDMDALGENVPEAEVQLFLIPCTDGELAHSVVVLPADCTSFAHSCDGDQTEGGHTTYNIVMVDTSCAMQKHFKNIIRGYNEYVAPFLNGETDIYTFGKEVSFKRTGKMMVQNDMSITGSSNLFLALKEIVDMIRICPHAHARVFLFSNNSNSREDEEVMYFLKSLNSLDEKKQVDVFVLTIENMFPIEYCRELQLRVHTGPANTPIRISCLPTRKSINEGMVSIRREVDMCIKITLSIPALVAPCSNPTKDYAFPGEYLYYDTDPNTLKNSLKIFTEERKKISNNSNWRRVRGAVKTTGGDATDMEIAHGNMTNQYVKDTDIIMAEMENQCSINIVNCERTMNSEVIVMNLFNQWTTATLGLYQNNSTMFLDTFHTLQSIFDTYIKDINVINKHSNKLIDDRMERKMKKTLEFECQRLIGQCQNIIWKTTNFKDEIAAAEELRSAFVQSKFDIKLFQMRGHNNDQWAKDVEEFQGQYELIKDSIDALPDPPTEECCSVMLRSFLTDIKNPGFLDVLRNGKLGFLKEITFSGIPIFAPVADYSQINPWTLYIKSIYQGPFEMLSQIYMEGALFNSNTENGSIHKEIQCDPNDPSSTVNCIVPIIPKEQADVLAPLVRTNVFAVGCTFSIMKNAVAIDFNCHIAALACVWMKTIKDHPFEERPEYIKNRISNIEETAKIYLPRHDLQAYIECCWQNPALALCTVGKLDSGSIIRCESLIKPTFLVHMSRFNRKLVCKYQHNLHKIVQQVLIEFIGRCLKKYTSKTPFMDFCVPALSSATRQEWLSHRANDLATQLTCSPAVLLKNCYDQVALNKFIKPDIDKLVKDCEQQWLTSLHLDLSCVETEDEFFSCDSDNDTDAYHLPNCGPREPMVTDHTDQQQLLMNKVSRLRRNSSAGSVTWAHLRTWALELMHNFGSDQLDQCGPQQDPTAGPIGSMPPKAAPYMALDKEDIDHAFGTDMVCCYLVHALSHRSSIARAKDVMKGQAEAEAAFKRNIEKEWRYIVRAELVPMIQQRVEAAYRGEFLRVHTAVARPMARQQIIAEARTRGVPVTQENFDEIYKYRPVVGLCTNCCQVECCPHFLHPYRSFSRHLALDRSRPHYPHGLHATVVDNLTQDAGWTAWRVCDAKFKVAHKNVNTRARLPKGQHPIVRAQVTMLKTMYSKVF